MNKDDAFSDFFHNFAREIILESHLSYHFFAMRRCPTCEEEIDEHLEVCPWCGRKTGFSPKPVNPLAAKMADVNGLFKVVFKNHKRTSIICGAIIAVCILAGGIAGCLSKKPILGFQQALGVTEVIDSFAAVMPQGSKVIARFNDDRHCIYYLCGGHLMKFNAVSKMLDEVDPREMDADATVYYNDRDDISGIIDAELDSEEKFIIIKAVSMRTGKGEEDYETVGYKLNTHSLNLLPYKIPAVKKTTEPTDSVKRTWRRRPQTEEQEAATTESEPVAPQMHSVEKPLEDQPAAAPAPATPAPSSVPAE